MLCLLRLAHPAVEIRIAGGRELNLRSMQAMGLYAANSLFVSDYLTTKGQSPELDFEMIKDLGFEIIVDDHQHSPTEAPESSELVQAGTCGSGSCGSPTCGTHG